MTSTLLATRGRRSCAQLDAVLSELDADRVTPEVRKAVRQHVRDCEQCQESKRRFVSPAEILGSLAPMPPTPGLHEDVWKQLDRKSKEGVRARVMRRLGLGAFIALVAGFLLLAGAAGAYFGLRGGASLAPKDPLDVHSTSHQIGVPSMNHVVTMAWTTRGRPVAYSISWTHGPRLPDRVADLGAPAEGAVSGVLPAGDDWYFNLRTKGRNGTWTHTVQKGPFKIVDSGVRAAKALKTRKHKRARRDRRRGRAAAARASRRSSRRPGARASSRPS